MSLPSTPQGVSSFRTALSEPGGIEYHKHSARRVLSSGGENNEELCAPSHGVRRTLDERKGSSFLSHETPLPSFDPRFPRVTGDESSQFSLTNGHFVNAEGQTVANGYLKQLKQQQRHVAEVVKEKNGIIKQLADVNAALVEALESKKPKDVHESFQKSLAEKTRQIEGLVAHVQELRRQLNEQSQQMAMYSQHHHGQELQLAEQVRHVSQHSLQLERLLAVSEATQQRLSEEAENAKLQLAESLRQQHQAADEHEQFQSEWQKERDRLIEQLDNLRRTHSKEQRTLKMKVEDFENRLKKSVNKELALQTEAGHHAAHALRSQKLCEDYEKRLADIRAELKAAQAGKQMAEEEKMKARQAQLDALTVCDERAVLLEKAKGEKDEVLSRLQSAEMQLLTLEHSSGQRMQEVAQRVRDAVAQCSQLRQDLVQKDDQLAQLEQAKAQLTSEARAARENSRRTDQLLAKLQEQLRLQQESYSEVEGSLQKTRQQLSGAQQVIARHDKEQAAIKQAADLELQRTQTENTVLQEKLFAEQERASLLEQQVLDFTTTLSTIRSVQSVAEISIDSGLTVSSVSQLESRPVSSSPGNQHVAEMVACLREENESLDIRLTTEMEKHVQCLHELRKLEAENGRLRLLLAGSPVEQAVVPRPSPGRLTPAKPSSARPSPARALFQSPHSVKNLSESPSTLLTEITSSDDQDESFSHDTTVIHVTPTQTYPLLESTSLSSVDHSPARRSPSKINEQHSPLSQKRTLPDDPVVMPSSPQSRLLTESSAHTYSSPPAPDQAQMVDGSCQSMVSTSHGKSSVASSPILYSSVSSPPKGLSPRVSSSSPPNRSMCGRLDDLHLHYAEMSSLLSSQQLEIERLRQEMREAESDKISLDTLLMSRTEQLQECREELQLAQAAQSNMEEKLCQAERNWQMQLREIELSSRSADNVAALEKCLTEKERLCQGLNEKLSALIEKHCEEIAQMQQNCHLLKSRHMEELAATEQRCSQTLEEESRQVKQWCDQQLVDLQQQLHLARQSLSLLQSQLAGGYSALQTWWSQLKQPSLQPLSVAVEQSIRMFDDGGHTEEEASTLLHSFLAKIQCLQEMIDVAVSLPAQSAVQPEINGDEQLEDSSDGHGEAALIEQQEQQLVHLRQRLASLYAKQEEVAGDKVRLSSEAMRIDHSVNQLHREVKQLQEERDSQYKTLCELSASMLFRPHPAEGNGDKEGQDKKLERDGDLNEKLQHKHGQLLLLKDQVTERDRLLQETQQILEHVIEEKEELETQIKQLNLLKGRKSTECKLHHKKQLNYLRLKLGYTLLQLRVYKEYTDELQARISDLEVHLQLASQQYQLCVEKLQLAEQLGFSEDAMDDVGILTSTTT